MDCIIADRREYSIKVHDFPMEMLKMRSLQRCFNLSVINLMSDSLVYILCILLLLVMKFFIYIVMLDQVTTGLQ